MRHSHNTKRGLNSVFRNRARVVFQHSLAERGLAMVEFAISLFGLLALAALIVDGSLLFQRQSLLIESGAELARRISAQVVQKRIVSTDPCLELRNRAVAVRDAFTQPGHLPGFTFEPTIIPSGAVDISSYAPYPLIRIDATAQASCLFCSLIPWELTLSSTSLLVIESASTGCSGGGNP